MRVPRSVMALMGWLVVASYGGKTAAANEFAVGSYPHNSIYLVAGGSILSGTVCANARALSDDMRKKCMLAVVLCTFSSAIQDCVSKAMSKEQALRWRGGLIHPPRKALGADFVTRCFDAIPSRPDDAIRLCTAAIKSENVKAHDRALAYAYRAFVLVMKDNYDHNGRAIADCNKAMLFDGKVGAAFFVRGALYANKIKYRLAIEDFDKAIALGLPPKLASTAFYVRGLQHSIWAIANNKDKSQFELAIADFGEAIKIAPNVDDYYRERASAENFLGQKVAAQDDLAAADRIKAGK